MRRWLVEFQKDWVHVAPLRRSPGGRRIGDGTLRPGAELRSSGMEGSRAVLVIPRDQVMLGSVELGGVPRREEASAIWLEISPLLAGSGDAFLWTWWRRRNEPAAVWAAIPKAVLDRYVNLLSEAGLVVESVYVSGVLSWASTAGRDPRSRQETCLVLRGFPSNDVELVAVQGARLLGAGVVERAAAAGESDAERLANAAASIMPGAPRVRLWADSVAGPLVERVVPLLAAKLRAGAPQENAPDPDIHITGPQGAANPGAGWPRFGPSGRLPLPPRLLSELHGGPPVASAARRTRRTWALVPLAGAVVFTAWLVWDSGRAATRIRALERELAVSQAQAGERQDLVREVGELEAEAADLREHERLRREPFEFLRALGELLEVGARVSSASLVGGRARIALEAPSAADVLRVLETSPSLSGLELVSAIETAGGVERFVVEGIFSGDVKQGVPADAATMEGRRNGPAE